MVNCAAEVDIPRGTAFDPQYVVVKRKEGSDCGKGITNEELESSSPSVAVPTSTPTGLHSSSQHRPLPTLGLLHGRPVLRLLMLDEEDESFFPFFLHAFSFVKEWREKKKRILVFCHLGQSCSATLTLACLMTSSAAFAAHSFFSAFWREEEEKRKRIKEDGGGDTGREGERRKDEEEEEQKQDSERDNEEEEERKRRRKKLRIVFL